MRASPGVNWTMVLTALIAAFFTSLPATIIAWRTDSKVERVAEKVEVVHKATNSLTDRLVDVTRSDALQEGHSAGVKDQKAAEKAAK